MFVRLTRPMRAKAGWFAALLYLFCVLAPGVALALGDAASCLTTEIPAAAAHQHGAGHQHHADTANGKHQHDGQQDGKVSQGPCCTLLCLSAIAADLPAIAKPAPPISTAISEYFQRRPGKAPPLLYRPPIA